MVNECLRTLDGGVLVQVELSCCYYRYMNNRPVDRGAQNMAMIVAGIWAI